MQKQLNKLFVILCGTFVVGCSSGTGTDSGSSSQPVVPVGEVDEATNAKAVQGPVRYNKIDHHHRAYISKVSQSGKLLTANTAQTFTFNNAQCAPLMGDGSNDGLGSSLSNLSSGVADGLINFVSPEAGGILGIGITVFNGLDSIFGGGDNTAAETGTCISSLETQIASQINYMENQITQLQQNFISLQNEFYQQNYVTAQEIAGLYEQSLNDANSYINGGSSDGMIVSNGLYQELMDATGLTYNGVTQSGANLQNSVAQIFPRLEVGTVSLAYSLGFQKAVQNISGSSLNISCSSNCFTQVQANSNTALIQTYKALNNAFMAELPNALTTAQNNWTTITPIIENYNNTITAIYLQQLQALQQSYTMEWMINRMNFYAYTESAMPSVMIPSLGQVAGTYYNYNAVILESSTATVQTHVNAYNNAQRQLAKLYAARTNVLFNNTISYLISDKPSLMQNPLIESGQTFYVNLPGSQTQFTQQIVSESEAAQINQSFIQNLSSQVKSSLALIPGNGYKNQSVFYQYDALVAQSNCENAMESYNLNPLLYSNNINQAITKQSCPLIYSDINGQPVNQGTWNAGTLQPYFINSNNQISLTSHAANNVAACQIGQTIGNSTGDLYFWQPSAANSPTGSATQYLMCNYWTNNNNDSQSVGNIINSNVELISTANYCTDLYYCDPYGDSNIYSWGTPVYLHSTDLFSNNNLGPTYISTSSTSVFPGFSSGEQFTASSTWYFSIQGLGSANVSGNQEQYLNLQMALPELDNLIVPFTIAVVNQSGYSGNLGAVACANGIGGVNLEATGGNRVPLCSKPSANASWNGYSTYSDGSLVVPLNLSPTTPNALNAYVITFLNNNQHNLYMSDNGWVQNGYLGGDGNLWELYYGPINAQKLQGSQSNQFN